MQLNNPTLLLKNNNFLIILLSLNNLKRIKKKYHSKIGQHHKNKKSKIFLFMLPFYNQLQAIPITFNNDKHVQFLEKKKKSINNFNEKVNKSNRILCICRTKSNIHCTKLSKCNIKPINCRFSLIFELNFEINCFQGMCFEFEVFFYY